jgi:hypothetical protein
MTVEFPFLIQKLWMLALPSQPHILDNAAHGDVANAALLKRHNLIAVKRNDAKFLIFHVDGLQRSPADQA